MIHIFKCNLQETLHIYDKDLNHIFHKYFRQLNNIHIHNMIYMFNRGGTLNNYRFQDNPKGNYQQNLRMLNILSCTIRINLLQLNTIQAHKMYKQFLNHRFYRMSYKLHIILPFYNNHQYTEYNQNQNHKFYNKVSKASTSQCYHCPNISLLYRNRKYLRVYKFYNFQNNFEYISHFFINKQHKFHYYTIHNFHFLKKIRLNKKYKFIMENKFYKYWGIFKYTQFYYFNKLRKFYYRIQNIALHLQNNQDSSYH